MFKIFKIIVFILLLILGGFFILAKVSAAETDVFINEIMWSGTEKSKADEFIELRNLSDQAVDLSGFELTRYDRTMEIFMIKIPTGLEILANDYFLISNYDEQDSRINVEPDYVDSGLSLSNSSLQIKLYDGDYNTANLLDIAGDKNSPLAGDNEMLSSMERNFEITDGLLSSSWHTAEQSLNFDQDSIELGSPKAHNSDFQEIIEQDPVEEPDPEPEFVDLQGSLLINEFTLNEVNDFIEILVVKQGIYDDWQIVYDQQIIAQIPQLGLLESEDYIILRSDGNKTDQNNQNLWEIDFNTNLNTKDHYLSVINPETEQIIDMVVWSNYDQVWIGENNWEQNWETAYDFNETDFGAVDASLAITGVSLVRNQSAVDSDSANDWFLTYKITPGQINIIEFTKEFEESVIVINEIVADPVDGWEWVELFLTQDLEIDLKDWILEEGSGKQTMLEGVIGRQNNYMVFNKSSLNNSGDILILKDPTEKIIDQVAYGDWDDGNINDNAVAVADPNSLARRIDGQDLNNDNYDFLETTMITKSAQNIIIEKTEQDIGGESVETSQQEQNSEQAIIEQILYSDQVIINELFPNPEGSDDSEFIELKNLSSQTIDLSGWKIGDSSRIYELASQNISANGYVVIEKTESGISLNNSGSETVTLYWPNDQIASQVTYEDEQNEGLSYSLWQNLWVWTQDATKGLENVYSISQEQEESEKEAEVSESSQVQENENNAQIINYDYSQIIISEIFPNPKGADDGEFIELYNSGTEVVDLSGLILDDSEGGSSGYKMPNKFIYPDQYLFFENNETSLVLNNTSDSVRILDSNEQVLQQVDYKDVKEDYSYSFFNQKWGWTNQVTKGEENIIQQETTTAKSTTASQSSGTNSTTKTNSNQIVTTSLEKVRDLDLKTKVKVKGVVAVEPGVLGKNIFYVKGSGIQIYFSKADFPELKLGDQIEITGKLSESYNEKRINISDKQDIQVLVAGPAPEPISVEISDIGESLEGYLVVFEGTVLEVKGAKIYVKNQDNEIEVNIKKTTGIKHEIKEGDRVRITGIVSQKKDVYIILPRYQADLQILEVYKSREEMPGKPSEDKIVSESENNMIYYYIFAGLFVVGVSGYFVYQKYLNKN